MDTAFGMFFSPGNAFRKVKEKATWIAPMVIVVVVLLVLTEVGMSKVNFADLKARSEQAMRDRGVPEDQIQQRLAASDKIMNNPAARYTVPAVTAIVGTVAGMLIVALILMLLLPLMGGTKTGFLPNLAVVAHAPMVRVIGSIVGLILILLRGVEQTTTSLSLAVPNAKGFLLHFLGRVNVFTIWEIILIAMGVKIVYDLKDNRSYVYLFGLWLIYIVVASFLPGAAMGAR